MNYKKEKFHSNMNLSSYKHGFICQRKKIKVNFLSLKDSILKNLNTYKNFIHNSEIQIQNSFISKFIMNFESSKFFNHSFMRIFLFVIVLVVANLKLEAQLFSEASPANWLYPEGNRSATRNSLIISNPQKLDSFKIKWSTSAIFGDVQPLIGNIIDNDKLFPDFFYAPNEISAVIGNEIIIVDAIGKVFSTNDLPELDHITNISALLDSNAISTNPFTKNPVLMGLESIEHVHTDGNTPPKVDSIAVTYIAGFDNAKQKIKIVKSLSASTKMFGQNQFASIKPVYARRFGDKVFYYALMNQLNPNFDVANLEPQFPRALLQFESSSFSPNYPSADVGDRIENRVNFGPEVSRYSPSISVDNGNLVAALSNYLSPGNSTIVQTSQAGSNIDFYSKADRPYLFGYNLSNFDITEQFKIDDMSDLVAISAGQRPVIRPYYVDLQNDFTDPLPYILVTEGYKGIDSSFGTSKIYLYSSEGTRITYPLDDKQPPFVGGQNHLWSIGVGNLDGLPTNNFLPYLPNNLGNEIVASQSSREFAYPGNKLYVFRFAANRIPKPFPTGDSLYSFDTVCTSRINGWVAAVADLDGDPDLKSEIVLASGSKVMVLRLRNYDSIALDGYGHPFDTVYVHNFPSETISSIAVADIEGDGKSDMVVTTEKATYILGIPLKNTVKLLSPIQENLWEYCFGDTINITWRNLSQLKDKFRIKFTSLVPSTDTTKKWDVLGSPIVVFDDIVQGADTNKIKYVVDTLLQGKTGYFTLEYKSDSLNIRDTSAILKFQTLKLQYASDTVFTKSYHVGSDFVLWASVSCADSVGIEYLDESKTWIKLNQVITWGGVKDFFVPATIPCVRLFSCDSSANDSLLTIRTYSIKNSAKIIGDEKQIKVLPAYFPLQFNDTSVSATRTFRWNLNKLKYNCDTIGVYFSTDMGKSYSWLANTSSTNEKFSWDLPLNIQDSLLIRFCCQNSCIRTDTLIAGLTIKYIDMVLPNPWDPTQTGFNVNYKVPEKLKVTIKVVDQANRVVAEILSNEDREANIGYGQEWNGILPNGNYLANGLYYISLEFSNGYKEIIPFFVIKEAKY